MVGEEAMQRGSEAAKKWGSRIEAVCGDEVESDTPQEERSDG
jgi:hypothetical protein